MGFKMNQYTKWIKESQEETQSYLIEQANQDLSLILNPCNYYKRTQEEVLKEVFK
jgi:hypothetical protein